MPRVPAERVATEIYDAIRDNVATKSDLREAVAELKAEISGFRTEFYRVLAGQTVVIVGAVAALLAIVRAGHL